MGIPLAGRRVNTQGTRNADDIDRPSQIFPVITTRTDLKRHSRLHHGMDVLPSSFTTGRFGRMFRHLTVFEQQPPSSCSWPSA